MPKQDAESVGALADDALVRVGSRRIVVRRRPPRGSSSLPALLLLHGAGGNQLCFDELLASLDAELEVLVPALPGRTRSDGPALTSITEMASFTREVISSLGLTRCVVAGHSLGGAIAIELALAISQEPARARPLAGLALMATGAKLRVHPAVLSQMEQAARTGTPAPSTAAGFLADTPPALIESFAQRMALTPPASALCDWRAANAFDRMSALSEIDMPTLVLAGDADVLTPHKYAAFMAAGIRGARIESVPGGGHMFPVERPRETAEALMGFVRKLG